MMRTQYRRQIFAGLVLVGLGTGAMIVQPGGLSSARAGEGAPAGISLRGYDPVAYFTVGRPTPGKSAFQASHQGRNYHFATATNRDAFLRTPAIYAPQYDGLCAMGMAESAVEQGDPLLWRIIDGKLYLNVGDEAAKRWRGDIPGNIAAADKVWQGMTARNEGKF